jgi:hypothetical protein
MSVVETVDALAYLRCPHCDALVPITVPVDVWQQGDAHPRVEVTSSWDSPIVDAQLVAHCEES